MECSEFKRGTETSLVNCTFDRLSLCDEYVYVFFQLTAYLLRGGLGGEVQQKGGRGEQRGMKSM